MYTWLFFPAHVCELVLCVCMWHRSPLIHQRSKSEGSPTAWQIGTPDLCLCPPLICPPRRPIIPPLPTCADRWRLHWGVLDLRCTVGPAWDWIRPDQTRLTLCLRVSGSGKSYRYLRGFFLDFIFPTVSAMNVTTPYLMSRHFQVLGFKGFRYT